jgi:hypothetical protein
MAGIKPLRTSSWSELAWQAEAGVKRIVVVVQANKDEEASSEDNGGYVSGRKTAAQAHCKS